MSESKIAAPSKAAGGWGALKSVAVQLLGQRIPVMGAHTLLSANQPDGFDCPGCAWPDREAASTFEFCENGVKAVAAEATSKRATPALFAAHTVADLLAQDDYTLEEHGRLTDPMVYDAASDKYVPIEWDAAFALIGKHLRALDDPNRADFYTSGRTSNEAAFLFQLFVREYGTNNFPDCSNMCHEPTSVGLPEQIGVGKGTVTLHDFEHADTIFLFGQNPGTNHPRMLGELRECAKRGATLVSVNPLRERGLERFADPQSAVEMLTGTSTRLSSVFITPKVGGDLALVKGMIKHVIELDDAAVEQGAARVLDVAFIDAHTHGFDVFANDVRAEDWRRIETESGVPRAEIESAATIYVKGQRVICTWGMGITQHKHSVATVQMIVNLLMLRGNLGKPGAGACPVRGHSNVQGDRTVGIDEKPKPAFLDRLEQVFGFKPPREHGNDVVASIQAMLEGRTKVFIGMGGNFAMASPDTPRTFDALRQCDLTVHITTKLNRSHLVHGREALMLPCLGRTEIDMQQGVPQGVTVEDSMSMVHLSYGINKPASPNLLSETEIVVRMAEATLPASVVRWRWYLEDYARIRDAIESVYDQFKDFNARVAKPGGFRLRNAATEREWNTPSKRANFLVHGIPTDLPIHRARRTHGDKVFTLMTFRSHDQYNTTIYGHDDRYRGVYGERRVCFMNPDDIAMLGLAAGQRVDFEALWHDGIVRRAENFLLVAYAIPRGGVASYYPETNALVPLDSFADKARTPTSKSIPVLVTASRPVSAASA
jgi:molybdopterin-dependent oxidoreductase alpha subunit